MVGTLNGVTELVGTFLSPVNDEDSLFAFRVADATRLEDEEMADRRGTRDTEPVVEGEARTEWREEGSFAFVDDVDVRPCLDVVILIKLEFQPTPSPDRKVPTKISSLPNGEWIIPHTRPGMGKEPKVSPSPIS